MPSSIVTSFAKKTGKSTKEVEKLWDKAITIAKKDGRKESDDDFFPYVTGTLKKMLRIEEDMNESLIDKLEKFAGHKIKAGRNTIKGYPVDIEDQDPEEGISMTAADADAAKGLAKELKKAGFKTKAKNKDILIENLVEFFEPIDEAAKDDEKKLIIQAIGKDKYNKYKKDITTKVVNGDFVVYDRGTILGKLKKDEWTKPKWMSEVTVKPKYKVGSVFKYYSEKSQKTVVGKVASVELDGKDIIYGLETGAFVRQSDLSKLKESYIPSFKEFVRKNLKH